MRTLKPSRVSLLTRTFEFGRRPHLVVSVLVATPLSGQKACIAEADMWKICEECLGTGGMLDEALSKQRAELVVHGTFFAPRGEPTSVSFAGVTLKRSGETLIDKKVAILGDRTWKAGVPTAPEPVEKVRIDWEHAFGGEGFAANPRGKGMKPQEEGAAWTLPNVEDRNDLVRAPSDRPRPAGFGPVGMGLPQRIRLAGTYDSDYLEEHFPGCAPDLDPEFFQTAPEDQRIEGFFRGNEELVFDNLHPTIGRLEGALTNVRGRAFVERRTPEGLVFEEVPLRIDTVVALPDKEVLVSVFRGMLKVTEDDGSDVELLLLAAEDGDRPKGIDHYRRVKEKRTDVERYGALFALADEDLMPEQAAGWGPARLPKDPIADESKVVGIVQKRMEARMARVRAEKREELEAAGLDPDVYLPAPPEEKPPPDDDASIDEMIAYAKKLIARCEWEKTKAEERQAELEREGRAAYAAAGFDWDAEQEKALAAAAGPPRFDPQEELARAKGLIELARNGGAPLFELEAEVATPDFLARLEKERETQLEAYRRSVAFKPAAARLGLAESERVRAVVLHAKQENLGLVDFDMTGTDLSGLDLSGMDLTGALLESANLTGTDLSGATLSRGVLARATLDGAKFNGARLDEAALGDCALAGADFSGADLRRAMMLRTRFDGAKMAGANLGEVMLFEPVFGRVDFSGAVLDKLTFYQADLRGARFDRARLVHAQFIECDLSGCDFSSAVLDGCIWVDTQAGGANLTRASMIKAAWPRGVSFESGILRDARIELGSLRSANLRGADLSRATLRSCDCSSADFTGATLVGVDARGSMFMRADFSRAVARGANFMETLMMNAILSGADFTNANLFRAMMSRAVGDDKTRFTGANVELVVKEPRRV